MADQLKYLFQFYWAPRRAAGSVLDHGYFLFGLFAAVLVTFALSTGATAVQGIETGYQLKDQIASHQSKVAQDGDARYGEFDRAAAKKMYETIQGVDRRYFGTSLRSLLVMAVVFVPVCIFILTAWDHLGGGMTVLFRDYMPVLTGLLFAWTAAQLPFAALWWILMWKLVGNVGVLILEVSAIVLFAVLGAFVLSTVMGVSLSHAAVAGGVSLGASIGAAYMFSASSSFLYMFASPWVLYYGYMMFGRDLRSLGGGLSARQNFKRQLEAATLNPRDADAHYQLGLLYAQRRSFAEAEKSFRRALEINPNESESLLQLGKLLRQQPGRGAEALELLERAVKIDPRLSNYEIWRELGAVALAAGRTDVALPQLEHYVDHREYDPEGLVLLGQALRSANRLGDAKVMFEKAIVAVKTAPHFRRHTLKQWESQARQELRQSRA